MNDYTLMYQDDNTVLLNAVHPDYQKALDLLLKISFLLSSPEYLKTFVINKLSIWNALSLGFNPIEILDSLNSFSEINYPESMKIKIDNLIFDYQQIELIDNGKLLLKINKKYFTKISGLSSVKNLSIEFDDSFAFCDVKPENVLEVKQNIYENECFVKDFVPAHNGKLIASDKLTYSTKLQLRNYQVKSSDAVFNNSSARSGVIVLPCGSGKTISAFHIVQHYSQCTLIVTPNKTSGFQWLAEVQDKFINGKDIVSIYKSGVENKEIIITNYNTLLETDKKGDFINIDLLAGGNVGLVIFDECHLLPKKFEVLNKYFYNKLKVGLTATPYCGDTKDAFLFNFIGPKIFELPWRYLEKEGWIATAKCYEIRVDLPLKSRFDYYKGSAKQKYKIAAENDNKLAIVEKLLDKHKGEQIIIISKYIDFFEKLKNKIVILTGKSSIKNRNKIFDDFRNGIISTMCISNIGNFALDLPNAEIAIQISGHFGSKQEEAQRLGRIMRPKPGDNQAIFYSLVTANSDEQKYSLDRQKFLCQQGYKYNILAEGDI